MRQKKCVGSLIERRAGQLFTYVSRGLPPTAHFETDIFFALLNNQDKTGHFSGVQKKLLVRVTFELHPSMRRGHHGEGAMRVRMLKSAAGQELARVTAVDQQSANLG